MRRPVPLRHDPLRAQNLSLLAGCAVAIGMLALDAILGSSRPAVIPDATALVMSRQSGALYVRVDGRLRPVANLASAHLILGSPATPDVLDEAALASLPDGPMMGIPGAPRTLATTAASSDLRWAVCDGSGGRTAVAVGDGSAPAALDPQAAAVVSVTGGDGAVYLLYDGKRAMIDPGDPATARALNLDGSGAVRRISATVLNAIPEVPAIGPPRIEGRGQPSGVAGFRVGTVVRVARTEASEYYVVLTDGLQRVGRLTVDLLRFADPDAAGGIRDVPPELITRSPLVDVLPVATYPAEPPAFLAAGEEICATWQSGRSGIAVGPSAGDSQEALTPAGSDGDGPGIDSVRLPPGRTLDVIDPSTGTRFVVTDAGVRFPVHDSAAAAALGLTGTPTAAPWPILRALPAGPELAREAALVRRDILGPAP
ncbi:type VII secretion protein EccB [Mycolicibacterium sarraceniae]|uniref:Type VII secretion protein EccB n=1 Tax=Mycolicibacterium sarraceniae TaxID=1534348 RepID=A0A7I7SL63_9MYCO|nr:type VII secretion protein EccB [Mycolicibacterium sarraceniae]